MPIPQMPRLPQNPREAMVAALLAAIPLLALGGMVVLLIAETFQGYISAFMLLALAGCSYAGARELKAKAPQADPPAPAAPEHTETPLSD
ncbi:MAG: hypothetical protein ABR570_04685 [Burkholderiales bacterium]